MEYRSFLSHWLDEEEMHCTIRLYPKVLITAGFMFLGGIGGTTFS